MNIYHGSCSSLSTQYYETTRNRLLNQKIICKNFITLQIHSLSSLTFRNFVLYTLFHHDFYKRKHMTKIPSLYSILLLSFPKEGGAFSYSAISVFKYFEACFVLSILQKF